PARLGRRHLADGDEAVDAAPFGAGLPFLVGLDHERRAPRKRHRTAMQGLGQHGPGDGVGGLRMDDVVAAPGARAEGQLGRHVAHSMGDEALFAGARLQRAAGAAQQLDLVPRRAERAHAVQRLALAAAPAFLEVELQVPHDRPMPWYSKPWAHMSAGEYRLRPSITSGALSRARTRSRSGARNTFHSVAMSRPSAPSSAWYMSSANSTAA